MSLNSFIEKYDPLLEIDGSLTFFSYSDLEETFDNLIWSVLNFQDMDNFDLVPGKILPIKTNLYVVCRNKWTDKKEQYSIKQGIMG